MDSNLLVTDWKMDTAVQIRERGSVGTVVNQDMGRSTAYLIKSIGEIVGATSPRREEVQPNRRA